MRQGHVQGQLDLGIAAAKDGYWEEARELLSAVVEADPACFEGWLWLGAIMESPADSADCLRRAIALRPDSLKAQRGLAWAEARLAETLPITALTPPPELPAPAGDEVRSGVSRTIGTEPPPTDATEPAIDRTDPATDVEGPAREAGRVSISSVVTTPGEPIVHTSGSVDWDGIMARLRALDREMAPEAADEPDEPAEAIEPERGFDDLMEHGKGLLGGGDYERAVEALQDAVALDPEAQEAREQLGVALYRAGRLEAALRTFEEIVERAPEHADARANVGFLLAELGRTEEAVEALRAAVSTDEELVEAQVRLGEILRARGDVADAIAVWRQALALRPGMADVRIALANLYVEVGRPENAIWELRQAIDGRPTDSDLYLALARALAATGRWEETVKELETALKLSPNRADLHAELGCALDELGQTEAAIARLERALVLDAACRSAAGRLEAMRGRVPAAPSVPARRGFLRLFG